MDHAMRPGWLRVVVYTFVWCAGIGSTAGNAAPPSFDETIKFGREIQAEFHERRAQAIIDRFDSEALRRRTFGPFGAEALEHEGLRRQWNEELFPSLTRELGNLGRLGVLTAEPALLLDGVRWLECAFVEESGACGVIWFAVERDRAGRVSIVDYHLFGMELPMSARTRQIYLLLGAGFASGLSDEEQRITMESSGGHFSVQLALQELGRRNFDEAFRHLGNVPASIARTRIWADLRSTLANLGSKTAQESQRAEYRAGASRSGYQRFAQALATGDEASALSALDEVIRDYHQAPSLRAIRANTLLARGHVQEAFDAGRELYRLNPFCHFAYLVALDASVRADKTDDAVSVLADWNHALDGEVIDRLVGQIESLAKFRASPAYAAWRGQARTTPGVTAEPPTAAPAPAG